MNHAEAIKKELRSHINPEKAELLPRFFKTGKGQYGEGDKFLGVIVPDIRATIKNHIDISLSEIKLLLHSPWHEDRMAALLLLVIKFKKSDTKIRQEIFNFYLKNTKYINNWDLVDLSCRDIFGQHVYNNPSEYRMFDKLSSSNSIWEKRIAIIGSVYFVIKKDPSPTLFVVKKLLTDKHDLIQKANGWMLREVGSRIDSQLLIDFLKENYDIMPRTTLRYAIEHFSSANRQKFLKGIF